MTVVRLILGDQHHVWFFDFREMLDRAGNDVTSDCKPLGAYDGTTNYPGINEHAERALARE